MSRSKRLTVDPDQHERLVDAACAMGVPVEWVLRAAIEVALGPFINEHDLVIAVEKIRDDPKRIVKAPRYIRAAKLLPPR